MSVFQKKAKVRTALRHPSDSSLGDAVKNGNLLTRLSFFILGLGNLVNRQLVRGFVFLGLEAAYVYLHGGLWRAGACEHDNPWNGGAGEGL